MPLMGKSTISTGPWLQSLFDCLLEGKPPFSHGFPMVFHGFPMVFLWFSHGFPMGFPMVFHGFPMVFPWFSYGFPMVFLHQATSAAARCSAAAVSPAAPAAPRWAVPGPKRCTARWAARPKAPGPWREVNNWPLVDVGWGKCEHIYYMI